LSFSPCFDACSATLSAAFLAVLAVSLAASRKSSTLPLAFFLSSSPAFLASSSFLPAVALACSAVF